jgi:hypothetical protein
MSQLLQARDGLVCRNERLYWAVVEFPPLGGIFKSHRRMTHDKASAYRAASVDNLGIWLRVASYPPILRCYNFWCLAI